MFLVLLTAEDDLLVCQSIHFHVFDDFSVVILVGTANVGSCVDDMMAKSLRDGLM